jgi:hypothetical protein
MRAGWHFNVRAFGIHSDYTSAPGKAEGKPAFVMASCRRRKVHAENLTRLPSERSGAGSPFVTKAEHPVYCLLPTLWLEIARRRAVREGCERFRPLSRDLCVMFHDRGAFLAIGSIRIGVDNLSTP